MNVYPVNAFEGATLQSPQRSSHSVLADIVNRYLNFTVDFNEKDIAINGGWSGLVEADTFIIANTNTKSGFLRLWKNNEEVFSSDFETENYINIIKLGKKYEFDRFDSAFSADENVYISLIWIGNEWQLPRFVTLPTKHLQLRNEGGRTFTGQVTGIPVETLKTFACSFVRINNKEMKIIEDYIHGVQTIIPHVIDPYPEAHEEFEPFFATVTEYSEKEKRAENGFNWNFSIGWQEAK